MKRRQSLSDIVSSFIIYFICFFVIIIIVYPLYFVVIASFSDPNLVMNGKVWLIPKGITF